MAIVQAVFAFISRSLGRIFSALFDWAVVALFGRVGGARKTALSVLMAAAAAWPLLLLGIVAPGDRSPSCRWPARCRPVSRG
jgi:hypothetical protein